MKKLTALFCALIATVSLTACGGEKKDITVDPGALASDLSKTVTSGTLISAALDVSQLYVLDDSKITGGSAFTNDGSTACEVAVIQSNEASNTSDVEKQLKSHVESQTALYSSYAPAEADKLKEAIIKSAGVYTVLCVTDDVNKANDILKEAGF